MSMAWVCKYYEVPAKRGGLVRFRDQIGRILSARSRLHICFGTHRGYYHPREQGMVYLDQQGQDLCVAVQCSVCKVAEPQYYGRCVDCLPEGYRKLVGK